jgi:polar amino acid transport system substrate-binding protein
MLWFDARRRRPLLAVAMVAAGSLLLAACSSSGPNTAGSTGSGSAGSGSQITTTWGLQPVASIAKLVPAKFQSGIKNGVYNDYPPEEFLNGDTLVGIQPDIVLALSEVMGTKINNVSVGSFDSLIPSMVSGRYDISSSDFGVTADRLKQVDFVTEFDIGTAFGVKTGSSITIGQQSDLCGHSIGVQAGSYFIDQVNTVSKACTDAGQDPLDVKTFPNDGARTLALVNGRTDVTATGQDALSYAAQSQNVPIDVQSFIYSPVVQGIIVSKGSGLGPALHAAMVEIINNGTYAKILAKWGLTSAAYTADQAKFLTDPSQA